MIWQQSKSISMHALMELWWQLAVTLNFELNVTQGACIGVKLLAWRTSVQLFQGAVEGLDCK